MSGEAGERRGACPRQPQQLLPEGVEAAFVSREYGVIYIHSREGVRRMMRLILEIIREEVGG